MFSVIAKAVINLLISRYAEDMVKMGVDYLASEKVLGKGIGKDLADTVIAGVSKSKHNKYKIEVK